MVSEMNIPPDEIRGVRLFRDEGSEGKPLRTVVIMLDGNVLTLTPGEGSMGEPIIQAAGHMPMNIGILDTGGDDS